MDAALTPFLDIRISHAIRHHWPCRTEPFVSLPKQYALWLIEAGTVHAELGATQVELEAGSVLIAPLALRRITTPYGAQWLSLAFEPVLFNRVDPLATLQEPALLWPAGHAPEELYLLFDRTVHFWMGSRAGLVINPAAMREHWLDIKQEAAAHSAAIALICQGLGRALFGLCWQRLEELGTATPLQNELPAWLARGLARANEEPGLSVAQLAREIGFSPAQLRRSFHEWLGQSPQQYLLQMRLGHARRLLETTDWPIDDVARHLGFASTPTFTRVFKENCGMPPAQYRHASRTG